jgi:SH3 domain protein
MTLLRLALVFCFCTLSLGVAAETLYVTDRLLADVHATAKARGNPVAVLPTGTPVDVLETRDDRVRVRAPGEIEGWVERRLLSEEQPAMTLVLKLQEQQQRTRTELERLKRERRNSAIGALVVVGTVALLLGFGLGALWLDHRIRVRHGGFRI